MKGLLLVALGGAIGSVARFLVALAFKNNNPTIFPLHTLFVNLAGCFAIGLVFAWLGTRQQDENMRLLLMTGVIGGFTTFSSFALETFALIREGHFPAALLYVAGSNTIGLGMVYLGYKAFYSGQ